MRGLFGLLLWALLSYCGSFAAAPIAMAATGCTTPNYEHDYICDTIENAFAALAADTRDMSPWCAPDRPPIYGIFANIPNKSASRLFGCGTPPGPGSWGGAGATWTQDCAPPTVWNSTERRCITNTQLQLGKAVGPTCCAFGDPINPANGNKYETRSEFEAPGAFALSFTWTYNSLSGQWCFPQQNALGANRVHTYSRAVVYSGEEALPLALVLRPDGKVERYQQIQSVWTSEAGNPATLLELKNADGSRAGWERIGSDGGVEVYNALGRLTQLVSATGDTQTLSYDRTDGWARLTSVTDMRGRSLVFVYDSANRLSSLGLPDGGAIQFGYDGSTSSANLATVQYPDGSIIAYRYGESGFVGDPNQPHALTSVVDETSVAYARTTYDTTWRATGTSFIGGLGAYQAQYTWDGTEATSTAITTPGSSTLTDTFGVINGNSRRLGTTESCTGCASRSTSVTYDANGYPDITTDARNITTDTDYSNRGLVTQRIEAANDATGAKRTIQTDWNATYAVPNERRTYNAAGTLVAKQTWSYNSRGQVLTASRIDPATSAPSTTTKTYCEQADVDAGTCPLVGLVRSVNGPRTDVSDITTYTYYASDDASCASAPTTCPHRKGDLWKVTNALGQVTETLAYDGAGRVLSVKDPNGVVTDLTYGPRGWLTARKVRGPDNGVETDDAITRIDYWPTGLVKQVTQPDGSYTFYSYDAAHRLTDISDNASNNIHYTLDNAGNRTAEDTKDPSATLTRTLSRVYNQLGQLQSQRDSALHATTFTYDANGNSDLVTDAASHVTDNDYDPLNRLSRTLQDTGGIAANTQFQYDAVDNLTQVTDPGGLVTGYGYDGLGNLTSLSSPDTGSTTYTYDSAGNRTSQTDARAKVTNYSYDALNRLATTTYGTTSLNVTSTYDTVNAVCGTGETFAVGRLTKLTMGNGNSTQYCYDRFGNPVRKVETINSKTFTLRYGYNLAGRLASVTYPDGNIVDYVRNAMGQVTEIGRTPPGGSRQVLLTSVSYYPFGPAKQWTFGNGRTMQRTFDLDYRPWAISDTASGGLSWGYTFNAVGNLAELRSASQSGPPQVTFGYDGLNRLTDFLDGPTGATIEHYAYNATGDRTLYQDSSGSQTYTYNAVRHRLDRAGSINRWYDASGNTVSIGGTAREYTFTSANRMDSAKQGGTVVMNYRYNGKGERVHRYLTTTGSNQTYTVYDEAGHWLGDYDSTATPIQQAIWLDGLPVGVLVGASTSQKLHYVEADALSTPRAVIDPTRNVAIWSWDLKGEAFGNSPPNQDPDLDSTAFVFNLRFPGQQYDSASNLNYNYYRDYDSVTGRYVESDPIGLHGGITTFGYADLAPSERTDRFGLASPPEIGGTELDKAIQDGMPEAWCSIWPATCYKKMRYCTKARCKHTDSCGKTWYDYITDWIPEMPTPDEVTEISPNCICIDWKIRKGEW